MSRPSEYSVGSEELGRNSKSEHYGAQAGIGPMNHFEILIDEAGGRQLG